MHNDIKRYEPGGPPGCVETIGCGVMVFIGGLVGFVTLCLVLKGLFQ